MHWIDAGITLQGGLGVNELILSVLCVYRNRCAYHCWRCSPGWLGCEGAGLVCPVRVVESVCIGSPLALLCRVQ